MVADASGGMSGCIARLWGGRIYMPGPEAESVLREQYTKICPARQTRIVERLRKIRLSMNFWEIWRFGLDIGKSFAIIITLSFYGGRKADTAEKNRSCYGEVA